MKNICLDIGGTSIKGGFIDNGVLIFKCSVMTNGKAGRAKILDAIDTLMTSILEKVRDFDYIGISSAGNINPKTGKCVYASDNLKGWTDFDIKNYFETKYKHKTYVENDAVSALYGELDVQDEDKNVFMVTLGTGVGATLYKKGEVFYGDEFNLGAFAHKVIRKDGYHCDCGNNGCAEKEISATGLISLINEKLETPISPIELFEGYRNKNPKCIEICDIYFDKVNKFLLYLDELGVQRIIIGGGLIGSKDIFEKYIVNSKVRYALKGNDAGIFGINKIIERDN